MGSTACTNCPAGSACPYTDAPGYICPSGYSSAANSVSCSSKYVEGSCVAGTFAWPNASPCVWCPEGFECIEARAPPRKCIPGYYSPKKAQFCTRCEAGFMCPSEYKKTFYQACPAGTYSKPGFLNCYPVPYRMGATSTATEPFWCNFLLGEHSIVGSSTCAACGADKECPTSARTPETCLSN